VPLGRELGRRPPATHELVDHTSELTMRVRAPDFEALLAEATRAFAELVPGDLRGDIDDGWRDLVVQARDRVAALIGWLNEVVYLCEAEQWLPTELTAVEARDELRVRARGEALPAPFVAVKAATLHGAFVREGPEGLEAEVTLDV